MASFHRFNCIVILSIGFFSIVLVATSAYLESPTIGNLTRTAGFSENDFGWNQPQNFYHDALFQKNKKSYQFYSDVVVLGDSFSQDDLNNNWVNYFVEATGLTAQVLHFNQGGASRLLSSPLFLEKPPKLFVFQSVEASLYKRSSQKDCQFPQKTSHSELPTIQLDNNRHYSTYSVAREVNHFSLDLDQASHYLLKALSRTIGLNVSDTVALEVTRLGLFSSQVKNKLLIHENDFDKQYLEAEDLELMACNLLAIQKAVEKNGKTRFVLMIAPDKLSAYSKVLADQQYANFSLIPSLGKYSELSMLRLDSLIQDEVERGTVDIYLPNDTHWGSEGYRFAAEQLIDYLNSGAHRP
ncbi:hypothetical protein [Agarivorans sp. JK6]|uniref:hypothetical protein n=1 Tax=Agarivorans sp. JK6 TaxID=2997426 RepID=UPI0038732CB0